MTRARHTPVETTPSDFDDAPTAQRSRLTEELAMSLREGPEEREEVSREHHAPPRHGDAPSGPRRS